MLPLTLYLRREPTTDSLLLERAGYLPRAAHRDVAAYRDEACSIPAARWSWFASSRPTRAYRRVMFNCYRWRAVWLADLPAKP